MQLHLADLLDGIDRGLHERAGLVEELLQVVAECAKVGYVVFGEQLAYPAAGQDVGRVLRLDIAFNLARQAAPLVPQLVAAQRQRFLDRWNDAMQSTQGAGTPSTTEAAQDRALSEATAFAIRIDVAEEITRLESHLDELERLLNKGGEIGKRLDFLIQELHREANTLGSKSAALELTHISVDMKVLIEQMREQVQNIE